MPGAVAEELEIQRGDRGPLGPPADGGEEGGGGEARRVPRRAYFTAISLALAAIVMFFMALTSSFIVRRGMGGDWQPVRLPRILWLNTAVLLASSVTIEAARRKPARGFAGFRVWWGITTALGFAFLAGQLLAWHQLAAAGVYMASNPMSSFFYVLTASNGAHLGGGLLALLYVAFRPWTPGAGARITQDTAAELASIYWHFMDGLWVFLFLLLTLGR